MTNCKPIKNTVNYFIHKDGYVFKMCSGKEKVLDVNLIRGVPKVKINDKKISLILLMIEYFGELKNNHSKISFKLTPENKLPLKNIFIRNLNDDFNEDESLIFRYKCKEKASSQNCRVKFISTITDVDVLNCLKRTEFKCFYCDNQLSENRWHLDHVTPLSKNGINSFSNITPSCKTCNLMKGAIPLEKFIFHIQKIKENFDKKNYES